MSKKKALRQAGRLLVLEGPDGVGKSTLSTELSAVLQQRGARTRTLSFPGRRPGSLAAHIYKLHHHPQGFDIDALNPASRQVLHVAAHIETIETQIRPAIEAGETVILDRFWWSLYAYGSSAGLPAEVLRSIIGAEQPHWRGLEPEMVFLITRAKPLRHELETSEYARVQRAYLELAKVSELRVSVVENTRTIGDTVERLLDLLGPSREPNRRHGRRSETALSRRKQTSLELRPEKSGYRVSPTVIRSMAPLVPTAVYDTYWRFAAERQNVFFRRAAGERGPWTEDPVLRTYKFTNAYRASDRVSQYLIRNVAYRGVDEPEELFFRIMLFKLFNKIDTWRLLERAFGDVSWTGYSYKRYDHVLGSALASNTSIYSAAYIIPSVTAFGHSRKHQNHLMLLERMMADEMPMRVVNASSMREVFEMLRAYPGLGDFLAYQFATDINYSTLTSFSEMEFVVPGPGARDGIRKCFADLGGLSEADVIRVVCDRQEGEFERLGLSFKSLGGRALQLIDCQNLFCEVDKYARVVHPEAVGRSGRQKIKQKYSGPLAPIEYWYPPKWGINDAFRSMEGSGGGSKRVYSK